MALCSNAEAAAFPIFILPDASQMRTMISAGDGGDDVSSRGNILSSVATDTPLARAGPDPDTQS